MLWVLDKLQVTYEDIGDGWCQVESFRIGDAHSSMHLNLDKNGLMDFSGNDRIKTGRDDLKFESGKYLSVIDVMMFKTGWSYYETAMYLSYHHDIPLKSGSREDLEKYMLKKDEYFSVLKGSTLKDYSLEKKDKKELLEGLRSEYSSKVVNFIPDEFIEHSARRKISRETLEKAGVKCVFGSTSIVPQMAFCSYENGEVVNVSLKIIENYSKEYLETLEKYGKKPLKSYQLKGGMAYLYGLDQINPDIKAVVITEGQFDKFSLDEIGVPNALSVTNGSQGIGFTEEVWFEKFIKSSEIKTVYVIGDNDNAGYRYRINFQKKLKEKGLEVIQLSIPRDTKDLNDFLIKTDGDTLKETLQKSKYKEVNEAILKGGFESIEVYSQVLLKSYYENLVSYIEVSVRDPKANVKELVKEVDEKVYFINSRVHEIYTTSKTIDQIQDLKPLEIVDPEKDLDLFQGEALNSIKNHKYFEGETLSESMKMQLLIFSEVYGKRVTTKEIFEELKGVYKDFKIFEDKTNIKTSPIEIGR